MPPRDMLELLALAGGGGAPLSAPGYTPPVSPQGPGPRYGVAMGGAEPGGGMRGPQGLPTPRESQRMPQHQPPTERPFTGQEQTFRQGQQDDFWAIAWKVAPELVQQYYMAESQQEKDQIMGMLRAAVSAWKSENGEEPQVGRGDPTGPQMGQTSTRPGYPTPEEWNPNDLERVSRPGGGGPGFSSASNRPTGPEGLGWYSGESNASANAGIGNTVGGAPAGGSAGAAPPGASGMQTEDEKERRRRALLMLRGAQRPV